MIAIGFDVEITGEVSGRALRRMRREAMKRTGAYWQQKMLPKHFQVGAKATYGMQTRGRKYQARKRKHAKKGGRAPLVFSGNMEALLKRKQIVKAFPTKATISIPGPSYMSMRPKGSRPNLGAEATAVNKRDEDLLTKIHDTELQKLLDNHKPKRRRKVK